MICWTVENRRDVGGKGKPKTVKIDYPKGVKVEDKIVGDYLVYEGKIAIKATIQREKTIEALDIT